MSNSKAFISFCNQKKEIELPNNFEEFKAVFASAFADIFKGDTVDFNLFDIYYENKNQQNIRVFVKTKKDYANVFGYLNDGSIISNNTLYVKFNQFGVGYPLSYEDRIKTIINLQVKETKNQIIKRLIIDSDYNNPEALPYDCPTCKLNKTTVNCFRCIICDKEMCKDCSEKHYTEHPLMQIKLSLYKKN